ncbi:hypothetical protein PUNSTDRAFT_144698 [Punctularia strigosozonata HHB-11173 SS5]|uniref:uncharacterized protein n=1 Tax=Punctularia strigosozonata (strain HHB-11173) TaxID=741275 RepID=UPI000441735D|nr:uncharacterized protein PUNSTDRAFT_144698 [Punctularia strigosozonata HHB-11173 SS5]EIN07162.1 hypothetical protein PUNSTDRAFT_144698 [Punctularia strigosozonata HHB-11173 SS5]
MPAGAIMGAALILLLGQTDQDFLFMFQITVNSLKLSELPDETVIVESAKALIESTTVWKRGKTYSDGKVQTFYRSKEGLDGANWYGRVSEHSRSEGTFDEFWGKLAIDKIANEKQYSQGIDVVTRLQDISLSTTLWSMYSILPKPAAARVFTSLQISRLEGDGLRIGYVVMLPVDLSDEPELSEREQKGAVQGRCAKVERIMELPNGNVEWRCACSLTVGGNIPAFVVERMLPGSAAQGVQDLVKYLAAEREADAAT